MEFGKFKSKAEALREKKAIERQFPRRKGTLKIERAYVIRKK